MNETNRKRLFLVCILARIFIIYLAIIATTKQLRLLSIPAFFIGISFLYHSYKKKKKGAFGGKAWWHSVRNLHSFLWILFALLAMKKIKKAYIVLIIDIFIGLIAFTHNYYVKI